MIVRNCKMVPVLLARLGCSRRSITVDRRASRGALSASSTCAMAALFIPIALLVLAQAQESGKTKEQSLFTSEEASVERKAVLPAAAVEAIRQSVSSAPNELNPKDLLASAVHLDGSTEEELVVIGVGGLRGAHNVPFWVLQQTNQTYRVLLDARGDGLKILNTTWQGYRVIEIYNLIARDLQTTTYRFDGERYRRFGKTSSSNR